MSFVYADLRLSNPRAPTVLAIDVGALVNTAANLSCLPEARAIPLRLELLTKRPTYARAIVEGVRRDR